jgi:hypothetical protein
MSMGHNVLEAEQEVVKFFPITKRESKAKFAGNI